MGCEQSVPANHYTELMPVRIVNPERQSGANNKKPHPPPLHRAGVGFHPIPDRYETIGEVQADLRKAGLESSNLIIAVDYTKSNRWSGEKSFGGRSLHDIDPNGAFLNPYQGAGSHGLAEVLTRYNEITPSLKLSGPTNFAPVIREAIECVKIDGGYHILVIIADGQVTNKTATRDAIVEASSYPISIIMVGVGDGPWEMMEEFDDQLPSRRFDNFQFVEYNAVMKLNKKNPEAGFAMSALMEIPEQFQTIRNLGLLEDM